MEEWVKLLIFSATAVVFLFVISKILGKKQIAELDLIDYIIGISIGSIAAEMATDTTDTPFYYYLIAMSIFVLFDLLITFISRKGPFLKRLFKSKPSTVIYNNKINWQALKKSHLDINDLLSMCRHEGYFDLRDIAFAVFETNGEISIMPVAAQKPSVVSDFNKTALNNQVAKISSSTLPNHLVIDSHISFSGLNQIEKNKDWLFKKLNIKNKKDLKQIALATYDAENNSFFVHYKNKK